LSNTGAQNVTMSFLQRKVREPDMLSLPRDVIVAEVKMLRKFREKGQIWNYINADNVMLIWV